MKNPFSLIFLVFFFLSASVFADDVSDREALSLQLKTINKQLSSGKFEGNDLADWTKLIIQMRSSASLCVANNESSILEIKSGMDGLGDIVEGEDTDVTKKRAAYQKEKEGYDKALAKCNLYIASSDELSDRIKTAEKSYFKKKYLAKSPDMVQLLFTYMANPVGLLKESGQFVFAHSGLRKISMVSLALSVFIVGVSVAVGIGFKKKLLKLESNRQWRENLLRAFLTTLADAMPYLLGSAVAAACSIVITYESTEIPFVTELFIGLLIFFIATTTIRFIFVPVSPAKLFINLSPTIAESFAKRLKILSVLGLIGYLAFYTVFSQSIIESNLLLLRNIFSLFFVVNVVWTLRVIIKSPRLPKLRYLSMLVIVAISLSLIAEWMGYLNLAYTARQVIISSFLALLLFVGLSKLFKDLFNAIDEGMYPWCQRVHSILGVSQKEKVPGLIWLRFLTTIVLWGGLAFFIISAWDYSGGVIEQLRSYIVNGFDVGDFRIIPSRVLWALLVFGTIVILSSWVRSQLENNWLKMTSMERGARDAVITIIGYIMFIVALLSGLSIAGFDFSNIAIIAGALSVGIGFGLQNIVNNFVSGLILLFERPIRKGDWIVVGGTEGTVMDIHIRSTRIQTFDRSDVIVPNSELISNQVTNWVLSSSNGRAIIPIGVAYGTDTEKVRDILLAIAEENNNVSKTAAMPKPKVLFREFGDSSLNFELRVFLHHVDSRLSVVSELNFAIDKAFREEGIEIPFPQRDLHVRSLPESFSKNIDEN